MKQLSPRHTALAMAVGTALSVNMPPAQAEGNPFVMQKLQQGYMVADATEKAADKAASESKAKDTTTGTEKKAAGKAKKTDAKKKAMPTKAAEGKCGEGKCGGKMNMPEQK